MKLEKLKTKNKLHGGSFLMPSMATDFKNLLIESVESELPLELYLDDIEGIDTLNLQILVSCKKTYEAKNREFIVKDYSDNFEKQARTLGLFNFLVEGNADA